MVLCVDCSCVNAVLLPFSHTMMKAAEGQNKLTKGKSGVQIADIQADNGQGNLPEGACGVLRKKGSDKALKAGVTDLKVDTSEDESELCPATQRVSEEETRAYEGLLSAEEELPYWQSSVQAWSPANVRDFDILRVRDASPPNDESERNKGFEMKSHIASPMSNLNSSAGNEGSFAVDDNGSPSHRVEPFTRSMQHASCRSPSWMRESIVRDIKFLEEEDVAGRCDEDPHVDTIPTYISLPHVSTTSNVASNRPGHSVSTCQEASKLSSELSKLISSESERCPSIDMPSASAKLSPQPLALKEARDEASASVASSADTAVHDEHHVPKDEIGRAHV